MSPTASDSSPSMVAAQTGSSLHPNAGVIAGIVVGSVIAALILLGIVVMIIRSKRKQNPNIINQEPFSHDGDGRGVNTGPGAEPSGPVGVFPKYELPTPTPTGVIPRQELSVEQTAMNATHEAQHPIVYNDKSLQANVNRKHPIVHRELGASEQRGELETYVYIAELSSSERRV
ncbi:hypothetical protein F4803DRAFT_496407 [Xylaria telfairii]|nr:hypothetical protein F4803DRAFT_496407 [Xylaria telfairii]